MQTKVGGINFLQLGLHEHFAYLCCLPLRASAIRFSKWAIWLCAGRRLTERSSAAHTGANWKFPAPTHPIARTCAALPGLKCVDLAARGRSSTSALEAVAGLLMVPSPSRVPPPMHRAGPMARERGASGEPALSRRSIERGYGGTRSCCCRISWLHCLFPKFEKRSRSSLERIVAATEPRFHRGRLRDYLARLTLSAPSPAELARDWLPLRTEGESRGCRGRCRFACFTLAADA